jgi:glycosyltransferase involved in cell wall biosynthesis
MRVLYSFPDTLGAPGIGTTAIEQVRSLARQGLDVHVVATGLAADPGVPCTLTLTAAGRRVRHGMLGRDRAGALRAYGWHDRRAATLLDRRRGAFDVVHCWPQATVRTAERARALGIPVLRQAPSTHTAHAVETIAALHRSLGISLGADNVHGHSNELIARELAEYDAVDAVLVPSEHVARTFEERGVGRDRLALHRFGCDLARFRPAAGLRAPDRGVTVLFVGRGEPAKGLHLALEAWRASGAGARARLVICGQIDAPFRRLVGPMLDDPSIELRGFVGDVAPLMREADVLLLPSLNEGSALVTYEAQASGCVLAVSDASGAPAEHEVHGLIHPAGDAGALARHLAALTSDRALLAELRARTIADRDRLSWDAAAAGLAAAYRDANAPRSRLSAA